MSDDMIDLLKSGKINNRLLCEMATHEGFKRLTADLEIYVDRIASMQIQNLNAYVDTVRLEIQPLPVHCISLPKYRPAGN
jgi:hypothetical protein